MRQQDQPSVEEILESIKRVIDRDSREAVSATPVGVIESNANPGLEATTAFPMAPSNADKAEEILDLGETGSPLEDSNDVAEVDDTLTNDHAADAMRQSLAALSMLSDPPAKPQIVRSGETSLEGMVHEMLRPMLAQWLDTHLPDIVERLVKAEIARIAGKKR